MTANDLDLLREFTRDQSQDAFTVLVQRHLDLVYCAALRQVRSPQLAEEIAQCVFSDLARNAARLKPETILIAWLYEVTRRRAINAVRGEARRRLREQIAFEMNTKAASAADWTHIEPLLDEAMHALDEPDRTAVLLRYFENKSLREVGQSLGTSDDAAQKRVSRAVERLREFFSQRGVVVGASALVVAVSATAVQAAPIGLAITVSTAASLIGTSVAASVATTATKAIAMTAMQKILITAALAAAGIGIYEAHQASAFQRQASALQQQQAALTEQIEQLTLERDDAVRRLAATPTVSSAEREQPQAEQVELLRLRNEVGQLRQQIGLLKGERRDLAALQLAPAADVVENREEEMRQLGLAASLGDVSALEKLAELSAAASRGRTNVNQDTHREIRVAFKVMGEAAGKRNETAFQMVWKATRIKHLSGMAIMALGQAAGMGNEKALEPLLDPERYLLLPNTTVSALKPAAEGGNPRAIEALAAVAADSRRRASWFEVADALQKPAATGNTAAIDALAVIGRAENQNVRRTALLALENAALNQHASAAEALRGLGYE